MKRFVDILKAVCPIGAAIMIYVTVMRAIEGDGNILLFVLASVFALSLTVSVFCISSLASRVSALERTVRLLTDDTYEQEERPVKECPVCHAYIDEDEEICPHCGGADSAGTVAFATDDPEYRGTDFSGEELLSAHSPDDAGV